MPQMRNIAVGLPMRTGHLLVLEGTDSVTGTYHYRALGGGIEFGETAEAALRREFVEELDVVLGRVLLLGVVENLFEYEGQPGHEIVHVYAVESSDIDEIPLTARLHVLDEGSPVRWVEISGSDRPFCPSGIAPMITALSTDVPFPPRHASRRDVPRVTLDDSTSQIIDGLRADR